MILIKDLKVSDMGRRVVYSSVGMGPDFYKKSEEGVISTWNSEFIFVKYHTGGSAATRPEDLTFVDTSV